MVKVFRSSGCDGLLVAYDNRLANTGVKNNLALNHEGRVVRYDKTGIGSELRYVEAGALCFKCSVFDGLPAERTISLEQEIYPELIARYSLSAFVTNQRFFDIGTPDRLEEFAART